MSSNYYFANKQESLEASNRQDPSCCKIIAGYYNCIILAYTFILCYDQIRHLPWGSDHRDGPCFSVPASSVFSFSTGTTAPNDGKHVVGADALRHIAEQWGRGANQVE